jgi:hypothetical protein
LGVGSRDKVFPTFSLGFSTAPPVSPPSCLKLSPVVFSRLFLVVVVKPLDQFPGFIQLV